MNRCTNCWFANTAKCNGDNNNCIAKEKEDEATTKDEIILFIDNKHIVLKRG